MTLAEHWNAPAVVHRDHQAHGALTGASCPATGNCTAVGWNGRRKALAAHWNGAWSDESPRARSLSPLFRSHPARPPASHGGRLGVHGSRPRRLAALSPSSGPAVQLDSAHRPGPYSSADYAELNAVSCISATN
jgi:hypothetical protein